MEKTKAGKREGGFKKRIYILRAIHKHTLHMETGYI